MPRGCYGDSAPGSRQGARNCARVHCPVLVFKAANCLGGVVGQTGRRGPRAHPGWRGVPPGRGVPARTGAPGVRGGDGRLFASSEGRGSDDLTSIRGVRTALLTGHVR